MIFHKSQENVISFPNSLVFLQDLLGRELKDKNERKYNPNTNPKP
jgi:hypothetical protein